MGFQFRLAKVLSHRKSLEDLARKDFLEAQNELQQALKALENYYQQVYSAQIERGRLISDGNSPGESLSQIYNYIKGTELKIESQKNVIRELKVKVEKMQLTLQEAAINYKVILKLESRQHEDYRKQLKKLEEKELNEMTNSRFNLRNKNE